MVHARGRARGGRRAIATVESTNFNGKVWLDSVGNFYSENARVTERLRLADANTMEKR